MWWEAPVCSKLVILVEFLKVEYGHVNLGGANDGKDVLYRPILMHFCKKLNIEIYGGTRLFQFRELLNCERIMTET